MGSVFTCKFNPCCGDRYNCEPPRQYFDPEPAPALASVAPSGAERLGREFEDAWDQSIDKLYETEPTQAVPAEDVAGLIAATEAELAAGSLSAMDWNTRSIALVRRLLAALTGLSARLAATETARYVAATNYLDLVKYKERLEAEASDLRRKLEEHKGVLAEAREHINRYADTAAEHDLVARIDALTGASE